MDDACLRRIDYNSYVVLAYHVIFTTYGFWLPNDPRGSGSRFVGSRALFQHGGATRVTTRRWYLPSTRSTAMNRARPLKVLLRVCGSICLLALVPAMMPAGWIASTHAALGFSGDTAAPVFQYMARSLSLVYALIGGGMWLLSTDIQRFRPLIRYAAFGYVVLGTMLLGIDLRAGMPLYWVLAEGPLLMLVGAAIWLLLPRPIAPVQAGGSNGGVESLASGCRD
jgi:hypothetical protein